jgi:putative transposase
MRACALVDLNRSMFYYHAEESQRDIKDCKILTQLYSKHKNMGSKLASRLIEKTNQIKINHKRIDRLRKDYVIMPPKKKKKKPNRAIRDYVDLPEVKSPNELWAIDFMHSRSKDKIKYKILNGVDVFSKEAICMHVDNEILSDKVVNVLKRASSKREYPKAIICDNGSEFCSKVFEKWAKRNGIELYYIEPGKPVQNCYVESFNSIVRRDLLNQNKFIDLKDCRQKVRKWMSFYNFLRPHGSINYQTPNEYSNKNCLK